MVRRHVDHRREGDGEDGWAGVFACARMAPQRNHVERRNVQPALQRLTMASKKSTSSIPSKPARLIATHAIPLLAAFGALLLAGGVFLSAPPDAVRTALVVMGASAVILALLRYQLEDDFEVGPGGLKGKLKETVTDTVDNTLSENPPPSERVRGDELLGEENRAAGGDARWRRRVAERVADQLVGECANCGKLIYPDTGQQCPHCGSRGRVKRTGA